MVQKTPCWRSANCVLGHTKQRTFNKLLCLGCQRCYFALSLSSKVFFVHMITNCKVPIPFYLSAFFVLSGQVSLGHSHGLDIKDLHFILLHWFLLDVQQFPWLWIISSAANIMSWGEDAILQIVKGEIYLLCIKYILTECITNMKLSFVNFSKMLQDILAMRIVCFIGSSLISKQCSWY